MRTLQSLLAVAFVVNHHRDTDNGGRSVGFKDMAGNNAVLGCHLGRFLGQQHQIPFQEDICFRDVIADTHLGLACDLTRMIVLNVHGLDEYAAHRDIGNNESSSLIRCGAIFAVIRKAGDLDMGVGEQGEPVFRNGPSLEGSPAQKHDINVQSLPVTLYAKGYGTEFSGFLLNGKHLASLKNKVPGIITVSGRCFGADAVIAITKASKQADIRIRDRGAVGVEDLAGNNPVGFIRNSRFDGTCPGTRHLLPPQIRGIKNRHLSLDKRSYRVPQGEIDDPAPGLEGHPHDLIVFRGIIVDVDPFILVLHTLRCHFLTEQGRHHAANSEDCSAWAGNHIRIGHLDGTEYRRSRVDDR